MRGGWQGSQKGNILKGYYAVVGCPHLSRRKTPYHRPIDHATILFLTSLIFHPLSPFALLFLSFHLFHLLYTSPSPSSTSLLSSSHFFPFLYSSFPPFFTPFFSLLLSLSLRLSFPFLYATSVLLFKQITSLQQLQLYVVRDVYCAATTIRPYSHTSYPLTWYSSFLIESLCQYVECQFYT